MKIVLPGDRMKLMLVAIGVLASTAWSEPAQADCTGEMRSRFAAAEANPALPMATKADADAYGARCFHDPEPRRPLAAQSIDRLLKHALPDNSTVIANTQQDMKLVCPHYFEMDGATRGMVWRGIFKAMIGAESSGYRDVEFWENGNPQSLHGEYSVGLIQLSISNARPYGCDLPDELALKDPARNLACAVRIMERLSTPRVRLIERAGPPSPGAPSGGRPKVWRYRVFDPGGIGGPNPVSLKLLDQVPGRPPLPPQWSGAARYWKTLQGRRARVLGWLSGNVRQCGLPMPKTASR